MPRKTQFTFKIISSVLSKPYIVFLIIASIFGLSQLVLVPAFNEPDEGAHFNRIYQITEGHLFGQIIPGGKGGYIPKSLNSFESSNNNLITGSRTTFSQTLKTITKNGPTINDSKNLVKTHFENTELYNPITYIPQVTAMLISKLFNFSDNLTFYLVRLFGFITWLIICTFALRKMGAIGWAAALLILTPLSVQMAITVSADSLAIAASLLFTGTLIEILRNNKPISTKLSVYLLILVALLSSIKLPYVLLLGLLILIPKDLFPVRGFQSRKFLFAIAIFIIVIIAGGWTVASQKGYVPYRNAAGGVPLVQKTQEKYIIEHPLSFLHKTYETYLRDTPYNGSPTLGFASELGLLNYGISSWAVALYFVLIGVVFSVLRASSKTKDYLGKLKQSYCFLIALVIFVLINVLIFISWSRISFPVIEGIQSRYFIPDTFPLLFFILPILKKDIKLTNTFYVLFPACLVLIQLAGVVAVYYQYYAPALKPLI